MNQLWHKHGLSVLALVLMVFLAFGSSDTNSDRGGRGGNGKQKASESGATVMCQDFVKDRLVAPSTAEFPWTPEQVNRIDSKTIQIISHVDSENKLGAKLRSNYACTVKKVNKDRWELLSINIQSR